VGASVRVRSPGDVGSGETSGVARSRSTTISSVVPARQRRQPAQYPSLHVMAGIQVRQDDEGRRYYRYKFDGPFYLAGYADWRPGKMRVSMPLGRLTTAGHP
jgi:hypothetical protein